MCYTYTRKGVTDAEKKYKTTEAQRRAVAKYDAKKTKFYGLKLNLTTDADILEKLRSVDNVQGYIKELIRRDISTR